MYKACIFDLDGTLANTLDSIAYFGNESLKALGLKGIETEAYKLMVGNGANKLMERMLIKTEPSYSPRLLARLREEYDIRYESRPMYLVEPYPGIVWLLDRLKEKGIACAVLSNKPDNMTKAIVKELFGDRFSWVQGQCPQFPCKPNPQAVCHILDNMGLKPGDVLYIGDSGVDMETGKNAGINTCGVLWGFRDRQELLDHGACFFAENAEQLLAVILDESSN